MELEDAKSEFIQAWGTFGSNWGVNRTMAQVHALLLVSSEPLCADDIMETLKISRGNANMNIRALIDWGLVFKQLKAGERREYFIGEKDMWKVVRQIIIQRKKKELEPVLAVLSEVSDVDNPSSPEAKEFLEVINSMKLFSEKADAVLAKLIKSDSGWLMKTLMKLIK